MFNTLRVSLGISHCASIYKCHFCTFLFYSRYRSVFYYIIFLKSLHDVGNVQNRQFEPIFSIIPSSKFVLSPIIYKSFFNKQYNFTPFLMTWLICLRLPSRRIRSPPYDTYTATLFSSLSSKWNTCPCIA